MELPVLHSMAIRLRRDFEQDALSDRQDWLLGCVFSELEYRRRSALREGRALQACHCELCLPMDQWSTDGALLDSVDG